MGDAETYLKTQQVADALGVSVSTVKRWDVTGAITAARSVGKHRRFTLSSVLQFARRENFPIEQLLEWAGPARPGEPAAPSPRPAASFDAIDGRVVDLLAAALKQGRAGDARQIIAAAARAPRGAVGLADDLIRPVMDAIGRGWMVGAWEVHQERQATQIVAAAVVELIGRAAGAVEDARPLALGAAPEGDLYTLPGILGELVVREAGWDVRNLGGNLPLRALAAAVREYRPGLVFLSASHLADRDRFLGDYAYFYEAATQVDAAIILGGRALDPDLRSRLVYASFGDRMAHLGEFARRVLPAARP